MTCTTCNHHKNESVAQTKTVKSSIATTYIGAIPVDTIESLPEYLLAERDIEDPATGNIKRVLFRVPSFKIIPNGNFDNIVAISGEGSAIAVQEGQVVAGLVRNETAGPVAYAASGNTAQFLVVGQAADGQLLIQNCGVVNIPSGHTYIIGLQYYTGNNGEPTTSNASGQKLFIPISSTKLLVNM